MWSMGLLKKFPRYEYQKYVGKNLIKPIQVAMQVEALSQGLANASFLTFNISYFSVISKKLTN